MKTCKRCGDGKPVEEFHYNGYTSKAGLRGRMTICKACSKIKSRDYYQANLTQQQRYLREKARAFRAANPEYERWMKIRLKYGLSQEEWENFYSLQQGRCAVCLVPLAEVRVCVDHDHETSTVRGLLCNVCNQGLGYFKDDPVRLRRAAMYVEAATGVAVEKGEEVMPNGD